MFNGGGLYTRCTIIGCWGGCCRVNEACSAYLLSCRGEHLLLDRGSGAVSILQNALPLRELHHVLLFHYHHDRCSDAGALSYGRLIQMQTGAAQQPLRFYGLPVEPYFEHLTVELYTYVQTIGVDDKLQIGPFCCTFHKTAHPVECLVVKVKCGQSTLVYMAGGVYTPKLTGFAEGVDPLIAECGLYAGADGARAGHMISTDMAQLGRKAAPGTLLLSHLPLYGDPRLLVDQMKAQWNGEVHLAQTLMTVELSALKQEESVPRWDSNWFWCAMAIR